ncbi:hypothetical protein [Kribbella catacumbae]|uniref:hypothetical protein n=1 Tax=Kribbella catacumbae TaxID=460086 RepID=UPI00035CABF4|nr:hypothetical protein [Kribbella catacumbae]
MSRSQLAQLAGFIGVVGAVVQIAYGVVALAVGHPAVDRLLPLVVLLAGIIAASFYTPAPAVHFPLLGLLWGPTWLYLATTTLGQPQPCNSPHDQLDPRPLGQVLP